MQRATNDDVFNFSLVTPLAYTGEINIEQITEELHSEGIFIFTVFTDPSNPFFIEVKKQMLQQDPRHTIKLIILGIRYNKEFKA